MGKVFADQSMSLDGFSAGANVGPDNPMGDGGEALHEWRFRDDMVKQRVVEELLGRTTGAVVIGRRTFDLGEKYWSDKTHRGLPVFVVTHRPKETITKQSGTTYTFVTGGIEQLIAQAREAAGDRDVVVIGGATVIQECIRAGLLDELRLHLAHILLGGGTSFFGGLNSATVALEQTKLIDSDTGVTHLIFHAQKPVT